MFRNVTELGYNQALDRLTLVLPEHTFLDHTKKLKQTLKLRSRDIRKLIN